MKLFSLLNPFWVMELLTFYGGGGKGGGDMPDTPDYEKLAYQQAALDNAALQKTTQMNRPNMETPWGSSMWTQDPGTFDQAGYDSAMANYNTNALRGGGGYNNPNDPNGYLAQRTPTYQLTPGLGWTGQGGYGAGGFGSGSRMPAPNRADFMTGGGQWKNKITLPWETQQALEAQQKTQNQLSQGALGMTGRVADAYKDPFDISAAPGINTLDPSKGYQVGDPGWNAVPEIQAAMMSRLSPYLLRNRNAEEAKMIAQGVGRGADEAWGKSQNLLGQNENDANQQALLAAANEAHTLFGQSLQAHQSGMTDQAAVIQAQDAARTRWLTEQMNLRNMPLDELSKLQSAAGQVQMPQFPQSPNVTAGNAASPQVAQAAGQGYAADMGKYNAGQQSNSNMWGGLMGLGQLGLGAYGAGLFGGGGGLASGLALAF